MLIISKAGQGCLYLHMFGAETGEMQPGQASQWMAEVLSPMNYYINLPYPQHYLCTYKRPTR